MSDMARRLTEAGHDVTVLTALPNYPAGAVFAEYRGRWLLEERLQGVKVVRTWIYATQKKAFVHRLLNYFSFVVSSSLFGPWKTGAADVIVVESPPLFLGLAAFLLSMVKRAKLVFNVSDLWPESAVAMGVVRSKSLIRLSTRLEEFLYRQSDLITGQTQGIVDNIRARFPQKKITLITNGVDVNKFLAPADSEHRNQLRSELAWQEKFVVGYAGLHGLAQGLETVLQAAQRLSAPETFLFAFFGDGPEKGKLQQRAVELNLNNVRFYPSQPSSRVPAILSAFDAAVIPLRKLEIFKGALPSKMFEAMAAALPLVVCIDGEAKRLVENAGAGICIEPEDATALSDAIRSLAADRDRLRALGDNGRRYVMEHYDRQKIAERFERLLYELHNRVPAHEMSSSIDRSAL
jgi:glycosyltransferase involved in cell wall biosynthesis